MTLPTPSFHIDLTCSEQAYTEALADALSCSFERSVPLLAEPAALSVRCLHSLNIPVSAYHASEATPHQELWQKYATLIGGNDIPAVYDVQRLTLWYQKTLKSFSHIVLVLQAELFVPALFYAAFHRLPLLQVHDTSAAAVAIDRFQPDFVTIVAKGENLSFHTIQSIYRLTAQQRTNHTFFQKAALGFLIGRDYATVTWMALKATILPHFLKPGQNVITWLPSRDNAQLSKIIPKNALSVNEKIYGPKDSFRGVMTQLLQQPTESMPDLLIVESHGGEHYVKFDDGVLCGASPEAVNANTHAAGAFSTPTCGYGQCCFRQDAIPTHSLTVKHLFISACHSLEPPAEALYPNRYNMGLNSLDGIALSYVGACMSDEAKHSDVFLYTAALRDGMPVGEVVRLLNTVARGYYPAFCTFLLVGNPQAQVIQPVERAYQVKVRTVKDQHWEVKVDVTSAALITVRLPLEKAINIRELCCKAADAHTSLPDPLYFTFVEQPDELVLYLYTSGDAFPPGRYRFNVSQLSPIVADIRMRASNFLTTYQAMLTTRLIPEHWMEQHLKTIKDSLANFTRQLSSAFILGKLTVQAIPLIEASASALSEQLHQAHRDILQRLLQYNGAGLRSYMLKVEESFYPSPATEGVLPCLCGNDVAIRPMHHIALDYTMTGHFCPLCGLVYHSLRKGPEEAYLTFRYISHAIDGQHWTVEIIFCNPTPCPIEGHVGLLVLLNTEQSSGKSKDRTTITYEPQQAFLCIPAGETIVRTFTIYIDGFVSSMHDMFVCFVSDQAISFLQHEILVTALPKDVRPLIQAAQKVYSA